MKQLPEAELKPSRWMLRVPDCHRETHDRQYFHAPAGSGFTCHESLDITSWDVGSNGNFFITGTATVNPTSLTGPCLAFFPGPAGFPVNTGFPAAHGHYNLGGIGGGNLATHGLHIPAVTMTDRLKSVPIEIYA